MTKIVEGRPDIQNTHIKGKYSDKKIMGLIHASQKAPSLFFNL